MWAQKLFLVLALFAVVASTQDAPQQERFHKNACAAVHMIVARATGEPEEYPWKPPVVKYTGVTGLIAGNLSQKIPNSDIVGVPYPATAPFTLRNITYDGYVDSEQKGTAAMTKLVRDYVRDCPDSKIVLMGYSQGAQVTVDTLCGTSSYDKEWPFKKTPALDYKTYGKNVVAAVMWGDPSFEPGQPWDVGSGTSGPGGWFRRSDVRSCDPWKNIMRSFCDVPDGFCACARKDKSGRAMCLFDKLAQGLTFHKRYILDRHTYDQQAYNFVLGQINAKTDDEKEYL